MPNKKDLKMFLKENPEAIVIFSYLGSLALLLITFV